MIKRITVIASICAMLAALSGAVASSASAIPPPGCYLVSEYKSEVKAGNWANGSCAGTAVTTLTGRWVLVEKFLFPTTGNLWCVKILLTKTETNFEEGYYTSETCKIVNASTEKNKSDYTEVIFSLPTLLLFGSPTFPIDIHSKSDTPNNGILTHLANASGTVLEGKGFSVLYSFTNLNDMSDSSYLALFLEVTEPTEKTKCNTEGDKTGEVLLPTALFLLVALPGGGVGSLQLVPKFKIKCGPKGNEPSITVEGSALGSVSPVGVKVAKESNETFGKLHCKNEGTGEPELSKYLNEKGEETLILTLLANAGSGLKKSCEEIIPSITLLPSAEVEIME
jgi:hypothetical protein